MKKNMEKAKKELELNKRRLEEMLSANLFLNRPVGDVRTTFQKLVSYALEHGMYETFSQQTRVSLATDLVFAFQAAVKTKAL